GRGAVRIRDLHQQGQRPGVDEGGGAVHVQLPDRRRLAHRLTERETGHQAGPPVFCVPAVRVLSGAEVAVSALAAVLVAPRVAVDATVAVRTPVLAAAAVTAGDGVTVPRWR